MNKVYLQLGSNLGERDQFIAHAVNEISEHIGKINICSKIYESTPWRVDGQENYLNQIIKVETLLSAEDILFAALKIENQLGRVSLKNYLPMHPADVKSTQADITKAQALGYNPTTTIYEGIKHFADWFKSMYI